MPFRQLHSHIECRVCGYVEKKGENDVLEPHPSATYYCNNCDNLVYVDGVDGDNAEKGGNAGN